MKVKLKKEIVTMGEEGIDPNAQVGTYVKPGDWNALLDDPDVLLIDTRNDYECGIGSGKGAVDPHTESFREFPAYVRKNLDPGKQKKNCHVLHGRYPLRKGIGVYAQGRF